MAPQACFFRSVYSSARWKSIPGDHALRRLDPLQNIHHPNRCGLTCTASSKMPELSTPFVLLCNNLLSLKTPVLALNSQPLSGKISSACRAEKEQMRQVGEDCYAPRRG